MVLVTATLGGSVYPEGAIQVMEGSSLILEMTPDPGYQVKEILVDNIALQPSTALRLIPQGDMTVHVIFSRIHPSEMTTPKTPVRSLQSEESTNQPDSQREIHCAGESCQSGHTITVGSGRQDYSRIQDAIAGASPGDRIIISPGRYQEQVIIKKPLFLSGESLKDNPVICGNSGNIISIVSDNVILQNINLSGNNSSDQDDTTGIFLAGRSDILIRDCRIYHGSFGIRISSGENITIQDCSISNHSHAGIFLSDTDQVNLGMNSIDTGKTGILGKNSRNLSVIKNIISGNIQSGMDCAGITDVDLSGNVVSSNALSEFSASDGKTGGLILANMHNITLSGNQISNNGGTGLVIDEAARIQMNNNTFNGNYAGFTYGCSMSYPQNHIELTNTIDGMPIGYYEGVFGKIIEGITPSTLYLQSCADMTIRNVSVSARNGYGIMVQEGHNISIERCSVRENLYQNILLADGTDIRIIDSEVLNGTHYGIGIINSHNITLDKNRIHNQQVGIAIKGDSSLVETTNNSLTDNVIGFQADGINPDREFGTFDRNSVSGGKTGFFSTAGGGTVIRNQFSLTLTGMNLTGASFHIIEGNQINTTQSGIILACRKGRAVQDNDQPCFGNIITRNSVSACIPVKINGNRSVYGNVIFLNDFYMVNSFSSVSSGTPNDSSIPDVTLTWGRNYFPDTAELTNPASGLNYSYNRWDTGRQAVYRYGNALFEGTLGNHWVPYQGLEIGKTGVGDLSYGIDELNTDRYPLIVPSASFQISKEGYMLNLHEGWNFIATPSVLENGSNTASIFSDINTSGHSIYNYSNCTWRRIASDEKILPLHGYWIYAATDTAIPLLFNPGIVPSPVHLQTGWNAIGSPSIQPDYSSNSLSSLDVAWSFLIPFNADTQQYDEPITRGKNEGLIFPSRGYWIYMDREWDLQPITG